MGGYAKHLRTERGSVGSMFRRRIFIGEVDPTLPRDGIDLIPLQFAFLSNVLCS